MTNCLLKTREEGERLMAAFKGLGWRTDDTSDSHHPDNYLGNFFPTSPSIRLSESFVGYGPSSGGISIDDAIKHLVKEHGLNKQFLTNQPMELVKQFTTVLKAEPQKSFCKAGITNGDDLLTDDGATIFLSWMLNKHGAEFKKEVVDQLLEESKK